MKFNFSEIASCTQKFDYSNLSSTFKQIHHARAGKIILERIPLNTDTPTEPSKSSQSITLDTPAIINYTKNGLQPHTLPDIEKKQSKPSINQIFVEHFMENKATPLTSYKEGIHNFVGIDKADALVLLDTLDYTHVNRENTKPSNAFILVETGGGLKKVSTQLYSDIIKAQKPDIFIPLADQMFMSWEDASKGKRIEKSVERTVQWFKQLCEKTENIPTMFLPLMGSVSEKHRHKFLDSIPEDSYSGVVICDYGLKPTLFQQLEIANQSLERVGSGKPRYLLGFSAPDEVIIAVQNGIDLFSSVYPYALTEHGLGSTYHFEADTAKKISPESRSPTTLNLFDPTYKGDFAPISHTCKCYACLNHTRAYIYHLLVTQEMLATVLLQIHNIHVYQEFFKDLRASLIDGTFPTKSLGFLNHYGSKYAPTAKPDQDNAKTEVFHEASLFDPKKSTPTTKEKMKRFNP